MTSPSRAYIAKCCGIKEPECIIKMTPISTKLKTIRERLCCLVPRPEAITESSTLLSSHEHHLCDCEVLGLVEALEVAMTYLDLFAAHDSHCQCDCMDHRGMKENVSKTIHQLLGQGEKK